MRIPDEYRIYVTWLHRDGKIMALDAYDDRSVAEAYARYHNRHNPHGWCEARAADRRELQVTA